MLYIKNAHKQVGGRLRGITKRALLGSLSLVLALSALLTHVPLVHAADEGLSTVTDKTTEVGLPVAVTDLHITGTGDDQESLAVNANSGKLNFGTQNATVTGANTNSVVLTGTRSAINSTLATMTFTATATGSVSITAELGNNAGNVIFNNGVGGNGHAYIIVNTPMSWSAAKTAAATYTYGGKTGYLATITDSTESQFIWGHLHANGWIGASDSATEGDWRWVTGPESGTQFWSGDGTTGHAIGGQYTNWDEGEPNNASNETDDGENCGQFWTGGTWNDFPCSSSEPFVVEFGDAGQPIDNISSTFTVTVNAAIAPTISNYSPAVGATGVAVDSGLSFTFNKTTYAGEGEIHLYNADGTKIQDFVNYEGFSNISQSGNTFTLQPDNDLAACTTYYMTIDNGVFYYNDGSINHYFAGTSDPTTWYFTTACSGSNNPPNNGDGNGDGIPDALQHNVKTILSPVTSKYVTVAVDESCDLSDVSVKGSSDLSAKDADYIYTSGFVNFTATGCDDGATHVKLYYHGVSPSNVTVRKYDPSTSSYYTIGSATVTTAPSPLSAALVSYTITDGGSLDTDGEENGVIVDPVGLGSLAVGAPDTGLARIAKSISPIAITAFVVTIFASALVISRRLSRR